MSRNFELSQQMEQQGGVLSDPFVPTGAETKREEGASRNTNGHAPAEILRLVHALFLSGGMSAPRQVLFCGVD